MKENTYKTVLFSSEKSIYKDRGSKFIGMVFPVETKEEVRKILEEIKSKYHDARHWCYAYRLGKTNPFAERANDDGEPAHSAGMPVLNQIRKLDLTDTLVIVVRYFGGVKLGVGGLIKAYKTAAQEALDMAEIVEREIVVTVKICFPYEKMNEVMRYIKQNHLKITGRSDEEKAVIHLEVPLNRQQETLKKFENWICE